MPLKSQDLDLLGTWFKSRDLPIDSTLLKKIESYHELILSWSKRINLISKNDLSHIIENHFLDSLGAADLIPSEGSLIDIGSGAGFPGVPLAMLLPGLNITLLESVHKRVLFLREVQAKLSLDNIEVIESRLERLDRSEYFDIATLRALPRWESLLGLVKDILKPDGKIVIFRRRGIYEAIDRHSWGSKTGR